MNSQQAQKIIQLNERSYNTIAQLFSQTRQYSWPDFEHFKEYIPKDGTILDIGCGNGRLIKFIKPYIKSYTGIDLSEGLLEEAKKQYPEYEFKQGNILDNFQELEQYTTIFGIAVLNHIPTHELQLHALENLYKLLQPGGIVCLTNWNLWHATLKRKSIFKYKMQTNPEVTKEYGLQLKDVMTIWKSNETQVPLYYYAFTKNEIARLAKKAGFSVLKNVYSHKSIWKGGNIITVLKK